ncbi:MAG: hypothetical protein M0016_00525 [Deltaproteobacteria bacterium]|jgi:hypothetical protein|nr:hypothetical protein [Deltaproteobacteria bacterium]MCL5880428.1 hypothetical protein [Deltaproteobacteria bacterium]MDA8303644.1 hypothetical protein [Deltaproteobacteria bacterium]
MSRVTFLRLFIGLFGIVFIVLTFWLSAYFHLSISTKIVIVLAFALATILAELIIAIGNLEKRLKAVFPSLELSLKEQIAVNETIMLYNKLKKKKTDISTRIAIAGFEKIHHLLRQAEKGGDFTFHDIYAAKFIILGELKPGQSFKVVSNLIEPFYWKSGKDMTEHTELNYRQAKKGIRIERVFVLKNEDDFSNIKEVMEEQANNNIDVFYVFKNDLNRLLPYASFAISEELSIGVISHREDLLGKVTITSNNEIITELAWQFDNIKKQSNKFNMIKKP